MHKRLVKKFCGALGLILMTGFLGAQAQPPLKPQAAHIHSQEGLQLAGATWHRWPEAQRLAQREHKPILLLQMFGELDQKWC